jgi:hypothetical protein
MAELSFTPFIHDERGLGLEAVLARLGDVDLSEINVMDIENVVSSALQPIAYGFDMLGPLWDKLTDSAARRAFILDMYHLQGRRGTPWSVVTALGHLGWENAQVLEMQQALYHNGFITARNGFYYRNSAPSAWYAWFVEIPVGAADSYTTADHADVLEVAQYYGPLRARLEKVILNLGTLTSSGGGTPSWSGTDELTSFGVSADGTTWTTHVFGGLTVGSGTATATWMIGTNLANSMAITHVGLIKKDGTVYASKTIPRIDKTSDIELKGSWTFTW